jgi:hypothetical protein
MSRLSKLLQDLNDHKWARLQRINHKRKMARIDATSPEPEYQQKLRWLAATGQGGELKKMLEKRQ